MRGLAFILGLSIVGCGGSELSFTPLQAAPHQLFARIGAQVELFLAARPTRPFVEIGMIQAEGGSSSDQASTSLAEMRGIAGQHGCDGLIILGANEAATAAPGAAQMAGAYRGSCIVYTDTTNAAAAPVAAAPAPATSALAPVAAAPAPPTAPVITPNAPIAATQITVASKPAAATCQPNAIVSCYGIGGCSGTQRCGADGARYSACACTQAATAAK